MWEEIFKILLLYFISAVGTIYLWEILRTKKNWKSNKIGLFIIISIPISLICAALIVPIERIIEKTYEIDLFSSKEPISLISLILFILIVSLLISILKYKRN